MKPLITIFTPTYNRASTLPRLYESLVRQTEDIFEWIIVDDGSTDNTFNIIREFNARFPIKYRFTENGGKHKAVNMALDIAEGELFFIVDSDDYLTETAVETVARWRLSLRAPSGYAGVAGLKAYSTGIIVGKTFTGTSFVDATSLQRATHGIVGDKAEVFFTDVLRVNKFPVFIGENFVSEAVVWNRIAYQGLKIRWFNETIYICDYRPDGLTSLGYQKYLENWNGYTLYVEQEFHYRKKFLKKVSLLLFYAWLSKKKELGIRESANSIGCKPFTIAVAYAFSPVYQAVRRWGSK